MAKGKPADLPGTDLLFGQHVQKDKVTEPQEEEILQDRPMAERPVEAASSDTMAIKRAPVEDTEPVKFTFYFPPKLLEDLEVAKFRLRMEKRLRVSKSDIVNSALQYVLKDLSFLERLVKGEIK